MPVKRLGALAEPDWMLSASLLPLGQALAGPVSAIVGIRAIFVFSAAWIVVSTVAILAVPDIREFRNATAVSVMPGKVLRRTLGPVQIHLDPAIQPGDTQHLVIIVLFRVGGQFGAHHLSEFRLAGTAADQRAPREQPLAQPHQMLRGIGHHAEVRQRQTGWPPLLKLVDAPVPRGQIELRRRRGRAYVRGGRNTHAGRIAGEQIPAFVEVSDMMGTMARGGNALEAEDRPLSRMQVALGNTRHLSPQEIETATVDPPRPAFERHRVSQVDQSALPHVDLQLRMFSHEMTSGARVIKVDMGQEQVPDVRQPQAARLKPGLKRTDGGSGTAVDKGRAIAGVSDVCRHGPGVAAMKQVDGLDVHTRILITRIG